MDNEPKTFVHNPSPIEPKRLYSFFPEKIKNPLRGKGFQMERVMGIEPTTTAWKAVVLPLNYTRVPLCVVGTT